MRSEERFLGLADLAESQWGLFTSAQSSERGITAQQLKRLADNELIVRLRQGVYRLAGSPEAAEEPIRAEWLALEPKRVAGERLADPGLIGVVSHRSAARMQQLGDVDADITEFTVARRRGTRSRDVKFHVAAIDRNDWRLVSGMPVTRPLRTVVDLAKSRIDGGHLASIVRDAVRTGDTTVAELTVALRPYAHYYGVPLGAGTELIRHFIEQAGVPESAVSLARNAGMIDAKDVSALGTALSRAWIAQLAALPDISQLATFPDLAKLTEAIDLTTFTRALNKRLANTKHTVRETEVIAKGSDEDR